MTTKKLGIRSSKRVKYSDLDEQIHKDDDIKEIDATFNVELFNYYLKDPQLTFQGLEKMILYSQKFDISQFAQDYILETRNESYLLNLLLDAKHRKKREIYLVFTVMEKLLLHVASFNDQSDLDAYHRVKSYGNVLSKNLLRNHKSTIFDIMLKTDSGHTPSQIDNLSSALKLLVSIVTQNKFIAKEALIQINFQNNNFNNLLYASYQKSNLEIRSCLIRFFASFYLVGDFEIIKEISTKHRFIQSFFPELYKDTAQNIIMLISVLHQKLITFNSYKIGNDTLEENVNKENFNGVSKTVKVNIFNVSTLLHLGMLYFWKEDGDWDKIVYTHEGYPKMLYDSLPDPKPYKYTQNSLSALVDYSIPDIIKCHVLNFLTPTSLSHDPEALVVKPLLAFLDSSLIRALKVLENLELSEFKDEYETKGHKEEGTGENIREESVPLGNLYVQRLCQIFPDLSILLNLFNFITPSLSQKSTWSPLIALLLRIFVSASRALCYLFNADIAVKSRVIRRTFVKFLDYCVKQLGTLANFYNPISVDKKDLKIGELTLLLDWISITVEVLEKCHYFVGVLSYSIFKFPNLFLDANNSVDENDHNINDSLESRNSKKNTLTTCKSHKNMIKTPVHELVRIILSTCYQIFKTKNIKFFDYINKKLNTQKIMSQAFEDMSHYKSLWILETFFTALFHTEKTELEERKYVLKAMKNNETNFDVDKIIDHYLVPAVTSYCVDTIMRPEANSEISLGDFLAKIPLKDNFEYNFLQQNLRRFYNKPAKFLMDALMDVECIDKPNETVSDQLSIKSVIINDTLLDQTITLRKKHPNNLSAVKLHHDTLQMAYTLASHLISHLPPSNVRLPDILHFIENKLTKIIVSKDEIGGSKKALQIIKWRQMGRMLTNQSYISRAHLLAQLICFYSPVLTLDNSEILGLIYNLCPSNESRNVIFKPPYLWSHKGAKIILSSLLNKQPDAHSLWEHKEIHEQIFEILRSDWLKCSTLNFPSKIPLTYESIIFENELDISSHSIYDPRYLLPLFYHVTSSGNILNVGKFITMGCLNYVLCGITSYDQNFRKLSISTLDNIYQQLFTYDSSFKPREQILFFLKLLKNTLNWEKRVPHLIVSFWMEFLNILLNPAHILFKTILRILLQSPYLITRDIPSFDKLYYSCLPQRNHERQFLLQTLESGLRDNEDLKLLFRADRCYLSILMSMHSYNSYHNIIVFKILAKCIVIDKPVMLKNASFLSWMVDKFADFDASKIEGERLLDLLYKLLTLPTQIDNYFPFFRHLEISDINLNYFKNCVIAAQLFHIHRNIRLLNIRLLVISINLAIFAKYVSVLNKYSSKFITDILLNILDMCQNSYHGFKFDNDTEILIDNDNCNINEHLKPLISNLTHLLVLSNKDVIANSFKLGENDEIPFFSQERQIIFEISLECLQKYYDLLIQVDH
ncbi:uncharacterized protein LOC135923837 isoform X2 [Gordionus sp. m RMFG-2023]|uniref:uncharacterized protein LOC135923837 isoform X2 n=1 Tax=Gordionus sp. m RMFG-2023 TaxID=3053472 RepID=UPI0031FD4E75